jgi:hypothetical protein
MSGPDRNILRPLVELIFDFALYNPINHATRTHNKYGYEWIGLRGPIHWQHCPYGPLLYAPVVRYMRAK